ALVPIFYINDNIISNRISVINYFYIFLAFLIWNIGSTHWICKMNFIGGLLTFFINSFLMTIPFISSFILSKTLKHRLKFHSIFIILIWISIEFLQENWQLAWPFYSLGNCFSMYPVIIQWYEYTGVFGGTLWILLANIFIYKSVRKLTSKNNFKYSLLITALTIIIPILISLIIYKKYENDNRSIKVTIVHPNLSCYDQKYNSSLNVEQQIQHHLELTKSCIDSATNFILWPETAIPNIDWIELFSENKDIKKIREFILKYPRVKLITGAIGFELYKTGKVWPTKSDKYELKFDSNFNVWYYTYNFAMQIDTSLNIPIHTKQKLVPFEERTPYPSLFNGLQDKVGSLGDFSFALKEKDEIFLSFDSTSVLTLICYESLFSGYTAKKVKNKSNIIFVILNEGWYGSTFGSKQFLYISAVRAIENRRSIARSSNYGISGFIDQKGEIIKSYSSNQPNAFHGILYLNNKNTFYTIHENLISRFSFYILAFLVIILILKIVLTKKNDL
ncbi:apolipoprotein N-acyltransferase, partial [Bacteroidota bacterium]